MKKLIFISILFVAFTIKAQQNPTSKNDVNSVYGSLMHKDIATVMKTLNIKDTVGKTNMGMFPKQYPGEHFLVLKRDNGEQLAFLKNKLEIIVPKH
jgi:hypothetical protein